MSLQTLSGSKMSVSESEIIKISQPADFSEVSIEDAKISNFEDLASYNWMDRNDPTILVPGEYPSIF